VVEPHLQVIPLAGDSARRQRRVREVTPDARPSAGSGGARRFRLLGAVEFVILLALIAVLTAAPAGAASLPGAHVSATRTVPSATYPGLQHLHYEFGPVKIHPGQNTIDIALNDLKPQVPGYITRFKPDLVYAKSRKTPRVDVIHLHHGVWLIKGQPTFAAGEEKTIGNFPQGYGLHHDPSDQWLMNHMIHNLTPDATSVLITYDIEFVPDTDPAAAGIVPVHPLWMDVAGVKPYPVFDAVRGMGKKGRYTFPDQAKGAQRNAIGPAHQWTVPKDITLVSAIGHLHPGGLYDDLKASRGGTSKELFRSEAKYWEPAGAVSWDVALTATKPDWAVALKAGDTLSTSTTYDVSKASWYESMGIMVAFYADGIQAASKDPFSQPVDWHGWITHGHLKENDNHGGQLLGLPNAADMLNGASLTDVSIKNFIYQHGDLSLTGRAGRPPVVRAGGRLRFTNLDAVQGQDPHTSIYHTITACRAPCNRTAGIAYPLANASPGTSFDSGELGYGPNGFTPAAQRNTWKTPKRLTAGTYTYFCRIHPFMRGSFRVTNRKTKSRS
jgi:plastocyanin